MKIPEETIAEVALANDIVQLIGTHVPLSRQGEMYTATCPFHGADGFTVDPNKQLYKCYGCGVGGTVFRFVMDHEGLSFHESFHKLAGRAGIPT